MLERNDLYTRQTPKAANLITRHIRLKLLLADHYDVFANTIAPNNPNVTGDDAMRARRKIDRTYALLRENGRRARLFLGDRPEPGHTSFIERLKASSLARSQRPTPLHIPELENEP